MNTRNILLALAAGLALATAPAHAADDAAPGEASWVEGGPYRLFARTFRGEQAGETPVLVVVLHGDAPFEAPDYQYLVAANIAEAYPGVVAAGLLRPGYTDPAGNHSEGERGLTNGDNWNAQNTDAIAAAIGELAKRQRAAKIVVIGHSGGAAITANILGRHPQLIDSALLVACPCGDLDAWRASMFALTGAQVFKGEIETLPAITLVDGLSDTADIVMLVGTEDEVTPPVFSESYRDAAASAGKKIELIQAPGRPHNMLLDEMVMEQLGKMLEGMRQG